MARKKKSDSGGPGSGDWLNTYADMVTLLLTFFILLYSMSSINSEKFNFIVSAFASEVDSAQKIIFLGEADGNTQTGTSRGPDYTEEDVGLDDIFEQLKQFIQAQGLEEKIMLDKGNGYVFIRFMDDMLFEPNSARLKPEDLEILNFVGYGIKSIQGETQLISINGHTAAIPDDPNYAVSDRRLSTDRANEVLMYFEDIIGIDSTKLLAIGWGKYKPFADNSTEQGRSQNRRVEILISKENGMLNDLDIIYEGLAE